MDSARSYEEDVSARPHASSLEHNRWKARARLEDQRRAKVRSAGEGTLCDVLESLEVTPAFEQGSSIPSNSMPPGRTLVEAFTLALEEASRLARDAAATNPEWGEELAEVVARRLANKGSSKYEHIAALEWPAYAAVCPTLRSTFGLAPSGLVTYSLGPGVKSSNKSTSVDAVDWELSGEGCWRVLPPDGRATEIILELCQGLEGRAPSIVAGEKDAPMRENCREPPRVLRIDLRECVRVTDNEDEEDEDELSESDDEDEENDDGMEGN